MQIGRQIERWEKIEKQKDLERNREEEVIREIEGEGEREREREREREGDAPDCAWALNTVFLQPISASTK